LFESELFGHVRGAFAGAAADRPGRLELADHGTLLFDEVGNLPLAQQAKLLRAVESGEFERLGSPRVRRADVRLISATNADLAAAVVAGAFRGDLLFRINTVPIHLPPLRARGDDILLLAHHFLEQHAVKYAGAVPVFDASAVEALYAHRWPGTVAARNTRGAVTTRRTAPLRSRHNARTAPCSRGSETAAWNSGSETAARKTAQLALVKKIGKPSLLE
jgi:transcriptional regulator with GAF, ATPase, and Fis domain